MINDIYAPIDKLDLKEEEKHLVQAAFELARLSDDFLRIYFYEKEVIRDVEKAVLNFNIIFSDNYDEAPPNMESYEWKKIWRICNLENLPGIYQDYSIPRKDMAGYPGVVYSKYISDLKNMGTEGIPCVPGTAQFFEIFNKAEDSVAALYCLEDVPVMFVEFPEKESQNHPIVRIFREMLMLYIDCYRKRKKEGFSSDTVSGQKIAVRRNYDDDKENDSKELSKINYKSITLFNGNKVPVTVEPVVWAFDNATGKLLFIGTLDPVWIDSLDSNLENGVDGGKEISLSTHDMPLKIGKVKYLCKDEITKDLEISDLLRSGKKRIKTLDQFYETYSIRQHVTLSFKESSSKDRTRRIHKVLEQEVVDSLRNYPESSKDNDKKPVISVPRFLVGLDEEIKEENKLEFQEILATAKEKLCTFNIDKTGMNVIMDFLIFMNNRANAEADSPIHSVHYNLIIRDDDLDRGVKLAETICGFLNISSNNQFSLPLDKNYEHYMDLESRLPHSLQWKNVIISKTTPSLSEDVGTGVALEAVKNEKRLRKAALDLLNNNAKKRTHISNVIICNSDAYYDLEQNFTDLFYRVFSHHIYSKPVDDAMIYQNIMTRLKNTNLEQTDDFIIELKKYFDTIYKKAELKGKEFEDDLINRVLALHYSKPVIENKLTKDCIPYYKHDLTPEAIIGKLDNLVGLPEVKATFMDIYKKEITGTSASNDHKYHMIFYGNPGTGKTTVAKIAANIFYSAGIIKTNKLLVKTPKDFTSIFSQGNSVYKTTQVIKEAYGGVLFIDEAYGFTAMGNKCQEILNELIVQMEEHADKFIVILAGYENEMQDLLKQNPGIESRIFKQIHFDDYTVKELVSIFKEIAAEESFEVAEDALYELETCIGIRMNKEFFGNAREMGNLFAELKTVWANEFYELKVHSQDDNVTLERVFTKSHFLKLMPEKKSLGIDDLVGLQSVKKNLEIFKQRSLYMRKLFEMGIKYEGANMHMIFVGNPGTGKTTVARLFADDLYSAGLIKTNKLVVAERKDIVSPLSGMTGKKINEIIQKSIGGILFIDEAYSLCVGGNDPGREAVEVLITAMEKYKENTVFIFAGYEEQMEDFLDMNPGIRSRIGYTFHFEDYSGEELVNIFKNRIEKSGFEITEAALAKIEKIMNYFKEIRNFGNGRFVEHVFAQTINNRALRDYKTSYRDIDVQDVPDIKALIETASSNQALYDPSAMTQEDKKRTLIHELGHAIVHCVLNPDNDFEVFDLKPGARSLGRVVLNSNNLQNPDEIMFINMIACLMAGRDAERLIYGYSSSGNSSDYKKALSIAEAMVEKYAMGELFKTTKEDFVLKGNALATEILEKYKGFIETFYEKNASSNEISGSDFRELLNDWLKDNPSDK